MSAQIQSVACLQQIINRQTLIHIQMDDATKTQFSQNRSAKDGQMRVCRNRESLMFEKCGPWQHGCLYWAHFSRKTVAWQVCDTFTSDQVQHLWDHGLVNEGMLARPTAQWPKSLSDRGSQMRSHSTKTYFHKLGILQLFSRPRQPNDNPRIEAHFGAIKTMPAYPGFFLDLLAAETYFTSFYAWYNNVHPMTTLNMLTPVQLHTGQAAHLLAARRADQEQARGQRRRASHLPFTVEDLIDQTLPDVSHLPVYSWGGPNASVK